MFRFTIRELILLTVIVAMGAAWWVDRRDAARMQAVGQSKLAASEAQVDGLKRKLAATTPIVKRMMKMIDEQDRSMDKSQRDESEAEPGIFYLDTRKRDK